MPKRKNSKHIRKNQNRVLVLLGIFIFLFATFLFRMSSENNKKTWTDVTVLEGLKATLPVKTSPITSDSAVWIESPTKLSILKGVSFTSEDELKDGENTSLEKSSQKYMYQKGFLENGMNTFSTLDTDNVFQVQSQGFIGGNMKCLFNVFLQSRPSGYFFCGIDDDEKNKLQEEFMPVVYGPQTQYPLQKNEAAVLNVSKINDTFATGSNNRYLNGVYEPSGTTWIAAKVNGMWKLVFDSQDYPTCAVVDEYSVPRDFYKNCYDASTDSFRFN